MIGGVYVVGVPDLRVLKVSGSWVALRATLGARLAARPRGVFWLAPLKTLRARSEAEGECRAKRGLEILFRRGRSWGLPGPVGAQRFHSFLPCAVVALSALFRGPRPGRGAGDVAGVSGGWPARGPCLTRGSCRLLGHLRRAAYVVPAGRIDDRHLSGYAVPACQLQAGGYRAIGSTHKALVRTPHPNWGLLFLPRSVE